MANKASSPSVREAVGIFFDSGTLSAAIEDLKSSGFKDVEISLLAQEKDLEGKLADVFKRTAEHEDDPDAPRTAFVAEQAIGDTAHGLLGGLAYAGAAVVAGAVVVAAGVAGSPIVIAAAAVAAFGGIAGVLGAVIGESDAEYLEEQIDQGHLLLFVRTRDLEYEKRALEILSKHSGFDVRIHSVPTVNR